MISPKSTLFVGVLVASQNVESWDVDWIKGLSGLVGGYMVGSTIGSALGVYLAGNSYKVKGSFRSAILGSIIGEALAICIMGLVENDSVMLAAYVTLPPICAAVLFNRSRRYKSPRHYGTALLRFEKGKMNIGISPIHVQPFLSPHIKTDLKKTLRLYVNVLSVVF